MHISTTVLVTDLAPITRAGPPHPVLRYRLSSDHPRCRRPAPTSRFLGYRFEKCDDAGRCTVATLTGRPKIRHTHQHRLPPVHLVTHTPVQHEREQRVIDKRVNGNTAAVRTSGFISIVEYRERTGRAAAICQRIGLTINQRHERHGSHRARFA